MWRKTNLLAVDWANSVGKKKIEFLRVSSSSEEHSRPPLLSMFQITHSKEREDRHGRLITNWVTLTCA